MFRNFLVIVMLLLMDHGNSTDTNVFDNKRIKHDIAKDECFCEGGCYHKDDLPFQPKCCKDICEGMELKNTGYDCAQYCPSYHSNIKVSLTRMYEAKLKELQDIVKKQYQCTQELRICHDFRGRAKPRIEKLTQELKKAQTTLKIIKVWVPVGFLFTILIAALVFAIITKRKMATLDSNNSSMLTSHTEIPVVPFQKNHWNELYNSRYLNIGKAGNFNENNSYHPGTPSDSRSTLNSNDSTISEVSSPIMVERNQRQTSSLRTQSHNDLNAYFDITHQRHQQRLPENHQHQLELLKFPQHQPDAKRLPARRTEARNNPQPRRCRESSGYQRCNDCVLYVGRPLSLPANGTTPHVHHRGKIDNRLATKEREQSESRGPIATGNGPDRSDGRSDEDKNVTQNKIVAQFGDTNR